MVVEPKNQYTNDDNNDVTDIFTESVHAHYGEVDNYTIIDTNKVQTTYYDSYINSNNHYFQTEEILIDENEEEMVVEPKNQHNNNDNNDDVVCIGEIQHD